MKSAFLPWASAFLACAFSAFAGEIRVKDGDTIVLVGDFITQYGTKSDTGYVQLFVRGLKTIGVDFKWIGAGVAGNKSIDMRNRFDTDVLAKNPTIVTINAGVNDVAGFKGDESFAEYADNINDMVTRAQAAGAKVVLLTPTTAGGEKPNKHVAQFADIMRAYAASNHIVLADTQKAIREVVDNPETPLLHSDGRKATADGVHMAAVGDREMARCLLAAFGLSDDELKKVEEDWNTAAICSAGGNVPASLATYDLVEKLADANKTDLWVAGGDALKAGIEKFLANPKMSEKPAPAAKPDAEVAIGCPGGNIAACGGFFFWIESAVNPSGFPRLLREALAANGSTRKVWTGRGERMSIQEIADKYDWIVEGRDISHLVVSTEPSGKGEEQDAEALAALAKKAQEANIKLILLTARPGKGPEKAYNEAMMKLANPPAVCVLDSHKILQDELARRSANPKAIFRVGGCELNPRVNFLTTAEILPLIGFDAETAERAKRHWLAMPDFGGVPASYTFGFQTFDKLRAAAKANNVPLSEVFAECLSLGAAAQ